MNDLKYSFYEENGWKLPKFDDSSWGRILSGVKISAKKEVVYVRATLVIPEGVKFESIKMNLNGYLLDAYIHGKKIELSDKCFFFKYGRKDGSSAGKLVHMINESWGVNFLDPGSYILSMKILIPEEYLYLETQEKSGGFAVFNL